MTQHSHFREDRLLVLSYRHLAEEARRLKRANRKLKSEIRRLAAEKSDGEEFALTNPAPKPKLWQGDEPENTRQTVLLSGLDCLPGQQDLFERDGEAGQASRGA